MKYFTYDLWMAFSDEDRELAEKAEIEWIKRGNDYSKEFAKTKEYLPKYFLNIYNKNGHFHDFDLISLYFYHCKKKNYAEIIISDSINKYKILYSNITELKTNFSNFKELNETIGDTIGYDEFLIDKDNILTHEILFASGSIIKIWFKRLSIKKLKE